MDRVALGLQEKRSETTTTRKEEGMVWPALTSRKKPGIFRKVNIVDGNFCQICHEGPHHRLETTL